MRHRRWPTVFIVALTTLLVACASTPHATTPIPTAPATVQAPLPLIPLPAHIEHRAGEFVVHPDTQLFFEDDATANAADYFNQLLKRTTSGHLLQFQREPNAPGAIAFITDPTAPAGKESYVLDIDTTGIRIRAREPAGLFYGSITLWQLLSAQPTLPATLPALHISDTPRFAWRGLMLDSARHYRSVDEIKQFLDAMAQHKLNTFHWHLTEDQGWRLEIKKYPKLTEIGAWRTPAGAAARDEHGKLRRYGGFYTQDQAREIVAYAAARHITVVPEIELPGHSQAAIAAYPELGVTGQRPSVANGWGVSPYLYNVDDSTFVFLQNVLDEVMAIFPSTYIHIGGDEAFKGQWERSAKVQQQIRARGIKDEHALQSWFITRIEKYLGEHDRKLLGWDEILEGGLPPAATVMSWRGTKGAIEAAREGHDVVLSPGHPLYFDQRQSDAPDEVPAQPALNHLEKVYAFDPIPAELTPAQHKHVLGAQANLWAEYMRTFEQVQSQAFPRTAALAEMVWTPQSARDWHSFLARMPAQLQRYRALGIGASDGAFAVRYTLTPGVDAQSVRVSMANQTKFGDIHYTLDGSEPTLQSPRFFESLTLPLGTTLQATSFASTTPLAAPRSQRIDANTLHTRRNEQLKYCNGEDGIRLEDDAPYDGPRAVLPTQLGGVCLRWSQAELTGIHRIRATVGSVANAFMYGNARDAEPKPGPAQERGELRVWRGECGTGELLATLPLAPARTNTELSTLTAPLRGSHTGAQDLCLRIENAANDLTWSVTELQLSPN